MSVPVTPVKPEDFTREWCFAVMKNWFIKNDINVETVKVDRVEAKLNSQQVRKRKIKAKREFRRNNMQITM